MVASCAPHWGALLVSMHSFQARPGLPVSAWGRESAPLLHVSGTVSDVDNRMHNNRRNQVKESIEVIDLENLSRDKFREVLSDYVNTGRSFRLVNVRRGDRSDCVSDIKDILAANGKRYRIRLNGRGWFVLFLMAMFWPIGIVAIILIALQWLATHGAEYDVVKDLFGTGLTVLHCEKPTGRDSENYSCLNELPEEDLPPIDSAEMFDGEKLVVQPAITYFAQIRKKYGIGIEPWENIRKGLIQIKRRNSDQTLYLGVVGEASAGKSTFINALLGFEFLKEDTGLGTTVASTILRYGESLSIKVRYLDGHLEELSEKSLGISAKGSPNDWSFKLLATLHKYTADEGTAQNVDYVDVELPVDNAFLKSGVAIVDTPGINSGNERHNDVTTRAIKEICDTALILFPANVPLSKYLADYIKENLMDVIGRCLLVMTQVDKLRPKERSSQLKYVVSRLKSSTGGIAGGAIGVAAYYALERDDYGKADEATVAQYRKDFAAACDTMRTATLSFKKAAILEKMLGFMNGSLLPMLRSVVEEKQSEMNERRLQLEQNQLIDMEKFIRKEKSVRARAFSRIEVMEDQVVETVSKVRQGFLDSMLDSIYGAEDRDGLKRAMDEGTIRRKLAELQEPFKESLRELCKPYRDLFASSMENFHTEFASAYRKLENISKRESMMQLDDVSEGDLEVSVSIENFGEAVDAQLGADALKSLGGAGAGAVIGSFICPGLGTVIGGVLGGVFGALFGKSLDTLKQEAYGSICSIGDDWLQQMMPQADQYIEGYKTACVSQMKAKIDAYKERYGTKVAELIEKERNEQESLRQLGQQAKSDLALFQSVQPMIEQMIQVSRHAEAEIAEVPSESVVNINEKGNNQ